MKKIIIALAMFILFESVGSVEADAIVNNSGSSSIEKKDSVIGNGDISTLVYPIGNFSELEVANGIEVVMSKDYSECITITTDSNIQGKVSKEVVNGSLVLKTLENVQPTEPIKVKLPYKIINRITAKSSSHIKILTPMSLEDLDLLSSSSSMIDINSVDISRNLSISTSSSSNVTIKNTSYAYNTSMTATSSSIINSFSLYNNYLNAKASSSASIYTTVEGEMIAEARSSGDIYYQGEGYLVKSKIKSSGLIERVN
ncbi:DUF2807 domain-containing protein (plasmid) [Enterococcus faecalis]|uniref:GIN domain-containing protein n=1 Tax=Enterococcus faecalis TaxID=1351 RepID=UPI0024ADC5D3|nr:DUF2807 domain-containing protein [Enterococcus faecalis]WHK76551.1 DUF2807 domain-containing protein [Enterococcus faecalis]